MNFFTTLFSTLIISALLVGYSPAAQALPDENEPDQYVLIDIKADKTQVSGGDTVTIGIVKNIYPRWHTYWQNPGDSGTPLEIKWDTPEGFSFGPTLHPIPKIIPYDPLTNYGHEGQTTLIQDLTLPANLPAGPITLNASIDLLVCHEICIPESHIGTLILNGDQAAEPEFIAKAKAKRPIVSDVLATFTEKEGDIVITIPHDNPAQFGDIQNINLLPIEWGLIDNTATTQVVKTNDGLTLTHKRGDRAISEVPNFPFVVAYTDQDGKRAGLELSVSTSASASAAASLNFIQALFLAVLGGLVLNLMPCVFPVLSMKALSLIQLGDKEEKKARAYGLSYTAGILVSFGLIASILVALKSGGAQIGWGFQLQSPSVIIALAYLVFIIGLNLSGFFEFGGRFGNIGQKFANKSGHGGAFWTGVLATLVATPCTAPFMGGAIGFALTQNAFVSLLVLLGLGFGLALPYLLLCYIPALRHKLPRPGVWMETFRQFLSFPMFITAAWLLWVLTQQASENAIFFALLGMIAIAFGLWMIKRTPKGPVGSLFKKAFLIIAIIGALFPLWHGGGEMKEYHDYSPSTLSSLLKTKDPVFVNMTAAWCITCKVNERIALRTDKTIALFEDKNIQYVKGDWTNKNAEISQYLEKFGRNGVPLYVFYPEPNDQGVRPEPILLPQILTNQIIFETISR